jgi:hypothetical protein
MLTPEAFLFAAGLCVPFPFQEEESLGEEVLDQSNANFFPFLGRRQQIIREPVVVRDLLATKGEIARYNHE